jgi:hypothetical protein
VAAALSVVLVLAIAPILIALQWSSRWIVGGTPR